MKTNNPILQKLRYADETYKLYSKNEKTLVGFSGGADSMTLLHALSGYLGKENLIAVHINHLLRGDEADGDEAFCESYCRENGIPFFARRIDVSAMCGTKSFEETARNVRYAVFEEIALQTNCTTVSLAHTADDNLETVIFHLCRGAGTAGLSGIPPKRPLGKLFIVRPLIDCTRREILTYAGQNALAYRTDATNENTQYTRNFIRKNVVPLLKEINPHAAENVRKTSRAASSLSSHLEAEVETLLPNGNETALPFHILKEKSDALLYAVFNKLYKNAGGDALPEAQAKKLSFFLHEGKRGVCLSLPQGITAEIRGEQLRFFPKTMFPKILTEEKKITLGENHVTNNICIFVGTAAPESQENTFSASAKIPKSALESLTVRPRKNGEAYRFGGMTRTLKKLLSGADTQKKNRPLLCDENGILWHPDFPVRDYDKQTETIEIHYTEIQ